MNDRLEQDEMSGEPRTSHRYNDGDQHHNARPRRRPGRFGRFSILKIYFMICGIAANLYALYWLIGYFALRVTAP